MNVDELRERQAKVEERFNAHMEEVRKLQGEYRVLGELISELEAPAKGEKEASDGNEAN